MLVEDLGDGELRILPTERVRERVRGIADRIVDEHPEAMEISPTMIRMRATRARSA